MKLCAPLIAGVVGAAALALVVVLVRTPPVDNSETGNPLLGKLAPEVKGTTLKGEAFDLDEFRGDWVLVNFFASWCPPCLIEHPELVRLSTEVPGLEVVSVSFGDTVANVEQFFADNGGDWPVLAADTGAIGISYGVKGLPESFLVAPDGTIVAKFIGGITFDGVLDYLEAG
jgi:cytochrome c biogenesis protein CcmG/thiol:disulfide interchange protein DsbE